MAALSGASVETPQFAGLMPTSGHGWELV